MKKFILLSALLLTVQLVTGCFGLVVVHPREKSMTYFCLGDRGSLTNGPVAATPLTEADLLARWGTPDNIQTNTEAQAVWHYRGDRSWALVMPAYVIGCPIPFPVGHNQTDIYFKNGLAQKARGSVTVVTGAMVGFFPPFVLALEKEPDTDYGGVVAGYGMRKQ
jgi:hypothetical protein